MKTDVRHDPCATCTLIERTEDRPWPVEQVKRYGRDLMLFSLTSGIALGVLGTLMVWQPW